MSGAVRRGPLSPTRRIRSLPWQHDLLEDSIRAAGITGLEVGTKLYVSNLDYGVTNEDIRELFAEIGDLKRFAVHYDKNGRSTGSAEVLYTRRSDAFSALKKYNNVLLDGRPMKIEIVGSNPEVPISARVNVTGANGKKKRTVVMTPGPGRGRGGGAVNTHGPGQSRRGVGVPRNGMRNGRGRAQGRGRGRGKKQPVEKSVDDLDKELESYHAEAMQT
uniref:RRM domain-containing protein n=1 Tax=Salix viminalis TaxID=40686 RepID=A0A6N2LV33_SALVM